MTSSSKPVSNDNGTSGAVYDLDALISGLASIRANIAAFETALESERKKEREYVDLIADARAILKLHGVNDDGNPNRP